MSHFLDRPIWNALSTRQLEFSAGDDFARRFLPDIGPLAGVADESERSLASLSEIVPREGSLLLFQKDPIKLPPGIKAETTTFGVQMMGDKFVPVAGEIENSLELLKETDTAEMVALAKLTKPGPFETGTRRLGDFWGIKIDGRLAAMAGTRMRHEGYCEISGVCVHPDFRGRGYARSLSAAMARRILDRGEIPYLHAYASNTSAVKLYESLGFRTRVSLHVAVLARETRG